jgi:hypothetical protein
MRKSKSGEVLGLSAISICIGRNAGSVGSLFTCTSTYLEYKGLCSSTVVSSYFKLVLFILFTCGFVVCPCDVYSSRGP